MPAQKVTWIIGASTGIGAALARELAQKEYRLALSARNEEALTLLKSELPSNDHLVVPLDVTDQEAIIAARDEILTQCPAIERVVFMAGAYEPMSFGQLDLQKTGKIIEVNLLGAFCVVEAVLMHLKQQKGQLLLCGSVSGYVGLPNGQPYGATKAGLHNLAQSLQAEVGRDIDVKLICPGFVKTRLTDKNNFAMPMRISAEKAAIAIAKGMNRSGFEIHFPKLFAIVIKVISILPYWLYFMLVRR